MTPIPPHSPAVETFGLTRRFGELTAVDRLSFSVGAGELFGLVGSDGAGKTTTLRMLASVLDPTEGRALVLGKDPAREAEGIREHIGYMSQRFGLYPDLTVEENIRFFADLFGLSRRERTEKTGALLEFSRLAPFRSRPAGKLSGGMKQKLGLICALIHTPKLLLLDEPTNGVDPVSRRDFWLILHALRKEGVTVVVATSYLDEAERCSRVGLIHRGALLACDTPDMLKLPLRGKIAEVRTGDPRGGVRRLRPLPDISVTLFGDRIHLFCAKGWEQEAPAIRAALPEAAVLAAEPTLEDVLVQALSPGGSP